MYDTLQRGNSRKVLNLACPLCCSLNTSKFYFQKNIPVHNNIVYDTKKEAENCKKGIISLTFCNNCGLIFNSKFFEAFLEYGERYDSDRSFSKSFNDYIDDFIKTLVNEHGINDKKILEVGCGDGSFLKTLCKKSNSEGWGFDPSYNGKKRADKVHFVKGIFQQKIKADVLILRHILEHIEKPNDFMTDIMGNIIVEKELIVVVEVPDFKWISRQMAYWDITYEHCNYFTEESLRYLFWMKKISVVDVFNTFSQYLVVVGRWNPANIKQIEKLNIDISEIRKNIRNFPNNIKIKNNEIILTLNNIKDQFTIWGAAGKGVTFINTLDENTREKIPFVIDINKKKQGKYCPGTDKKIMPPSILKQKKINHIVVMNPNYFDEITQHLKDYGREFNLIKV
jgi:hypothetical protein